MNFRYFAALLDAVVEATLVLLDHPAAFLAALLAPVRAVLLLAGPDRRLYRGDMVRQAF